MRMFFAFGGVVATAVVISILALVTHVVACIKYAALLLLVIGCVLPPVGVIHGIMIWFGADWAH